MATIDRDKLLSDTKEWLPESNTLSDGKISFINESVITSVGDNDSYYGEVLCKSLYACAEMNKAFDSVDSGNVSRERAGQVEIYYDTKKTTWAEYIKSLPNVCILFGYEVKKAAGGIKVSPGEIYDPLSGCLFPSDTTDF